MRETKQRKVMLECLQSLKSHPTADELYPILKKHLPSISLCSIYRNLSVLSKNNKIMVLEGCGPSMRFDGCTKKHIHLKCKACNAVEDYEEPYARQIISLANKIISSDPRLKSWKIEFSGLCKSCYEKEKLNKKKGEDK